MSQSYPEDSAGGLMDPDVLTIRPDVTLDVVLALSAGPREELPEVFDLLFVVDRNGQIPGKPEAGGPAHPRIPSSSRRPT